MAKKIKQPEFSKEFLESEYYQLLLSRKASMQAILDNLRPVSQFQAALLEANGGLVLGGKRNANGDLIIEEIKEEKPRLRG